MGDLIPFRRRTRPKRWTRAEDYGRVLPTGVWEARSGRLSRTRRLGRWAWAMRPWVLVIAIIAVWKFYDPLRIDPPAALAMKPEEVSGSFTRCGPGRGVFCVIDGDTFRLNERAIRIIGIDAPETHPARCAQEAVLGEEATKRLQGLLSAGPFLMTGRIDDPKDGYGRDLRAISRKMPNGETVSIAEAMIATGTVRPYAGEARDGWCE